MYTSVYVRPCRYERTTMLQPKPLDTETERQEYLAFLRECISQAPLPTNRAGMNWLASPARPRSRR